MALITCYVTVYDGDNVINTQSVLFSECYIIKELSDMLCNISIISKT